MGQPVETELKLHLPAGAVSAVRHSAPLRAATARTVRLEAIYLDTADHLLQRSGMALRLRREGERWMQTLKLAAPAQGGLSARREWEGPAKVVRGAPRLDLTLLQETPLTALLARHRAARRLGERFRTRVVRTLWQIAFGRSRIEVALDRGRIETRRGQRRVTAPISELELELKAGRVGDLIACADRLAGRGAKALALVPAVRSKAERGYLLASNAAPVVTKASARGFVERLGPDLASGAALRAIMTHGLNVLLANTEALRESRDPEFVHQARVALRRMRSAQRLLDRRHADVPAALAAELRWIGQCLGVARDWDVFESSTLPELLGSASPSVRSQWLQLQTRARRRRAEAHRTARAELGSARFARLALRLQDWTLTPPPRARALSRIAARRLAKAHARLFDAARFFAALSPERRHRVRILAKRLRYALDLLAVTLPPGPTARYVDALAALQDDLGALNDAAVARRLLGELHVKGALLEFAENRLDALERKELRRAEERLQALAALERPWEAAA
jgi:inorganic triphosphatase YgiF